MQHPFAGLIQTEQKSGAVEPAVSNPTRRGLFALIAGTLAAGTIAVIGTSSDAEARVTTMALGEEGGRRTSSRWGEDGGYRRRSTSMWWGEEGGRGHRRSTSIWWGEEGGYRRRHMKK